MSKGVKTYLTVATVILIIAAAFSGGYLASSVIAKQNNGNYTVNTPLLAGSSGNSSKSGTADVQNLFKPFWQTWSLVHELYVDQPVDDTQLMRGAIQGMLASLGDEHTSYIEPQLLQQENAQLEGEYEGIGAYVDTTGEYLTITSPMAGSPAEQAGLKPGDQVIQVDGEDMTGKTGEFALHKVLGPDGTEVTLTIQRAGVTAPFDVTLKRTKISVPSVAGKMLDHQIGYIQISTFGDKTSAELKSTLTDLLAQKPQGLILDLRYNGGGYLNAAVDVGSQFLDSGVLMYEQYGSGEVKEYKVEPGGMATQVPLVVLVNEGTASASEIVAGAIQDMKRGKLVGVTTYGKGSVQNWIDLENDQGAVRITIARWLTPDKRQINKVGLTPDYRVELTEEDIHNGNDAQLKKAIAVLTEQ